MRCNILDKSTGKFIGLDPAVYTLKPCHADSFKYAMEIDFNKEPENIIEEIRALIEVIKLTFVK